MKMILNPSRCNKRNDADIRQDKKLHPKIETTSRYPTLDTTTQTTAAKTAQPGQKPDLLDAEEKQHTRQELTDEDGIALLVSKDEHNRKRKLPSISSSATFEYDTHGSENL